MLSSQHITGLFRDMAIIHRSTPCRSASSRSWFVVASIALSASLLGGCGADQQPAGKALIASEASVPVVVVNAQRKTVPLSVEGIGTVEAIASVAVKSRIDGQIVKVAFADGDDVKPGQVLFEMDCRPALAQLRQAEAKLASDMALLARARAQDARYQDLLRQRFVSADGYQQYKTNLDSALANAAAARATVDSARLQIDYCTIRAPIAGRAGRIMIQQGNLVKANDGNPLVVINQLTPIFVNFSVPEQYLAQVRSAGAGVVKVVATDADGKAVEASATLAFVDNAVDPATGTVKLRASVANRDSGLWPGQFVHAVLALGERADALIVPAEAVQTGPRGSYVFVVGADGKAQLRDVVVERTAGAEALIAEGLAVGETVVVDGQSRLLPGSPIVIRDAAGKS
ncbi:MAG: efflux RND transporter periplasmic adaptor subunit [Candidatus Accumulibacter phosphatis]